MKIGIDGRLLSRPLTGIGRYTFEMCQRLALEKNISLFLYSPAPYTCPLLEFSESTLRHNHCKGSLQRQFWGDFLLPIWARKDAPDIFWGPAHRLPPFLPAAMAKIVTIHDLVWWEWPETMNRATFFLEKTHVPSTLKRADAIVASSRATITSLKRAFPLTADKTHLIYPGTSPLLPPEEPAFVDQYGIKRPYFLFVGTLEPRKNLVRLLEAYGGLPEALREEVSFVIAGGKGWGNDNIQDHIERLNLSEQVHVIGYVDEKSLSTLYAHALFLTMPSLGEGFGLPLTEAMTRGVPVLTSHSSSMPEVAGEAGLLVDPLNIPSIQEGLFTMITDTSLRTAYASKTRAQSEKFSWDKAVSELMVLFEETLHKKKCFFKRKIASVLRN
jgi:glycosyltransferase involved in cell wall biosynthesis